VIVFPAIFSAIHLVVSLRRTGSAVSHNCESYHAER
jgi:hypothetical protein